MPRTGRRDRKARTRTKSPGNQTQGTEEVSPSGQNGEHDIRYPHPQEGAQARAQGLYAIEPVAPKFNPWSSCPITFDRQDHPTSIRHGGCRMWGSGKTLKVQTLGCARSSFPPTDPRPSSLRSHRRTRCTRNTERHEIYTGSGHRCGVIPYTSVVVVGCL